MILACQCQMLIIPIKKMDNIEKALFLEKETG